MLVDMHLHALPHSTDSFITLEQIVAIAREKGLDGVCLTDHDSMGGKEFAEEYSRKIDFPIFVGIEYFSLQGDITTWGVNSYPDKRIGAQPWLDFVNESNGFCCACHHFRNNNRGLEENLGWVKGLHGVEVLNGSTPMETNRIALKWCKELGLQPIGASDAHVIKQIGKYATWLPEKVDNLADFVALLRSRPVKPAIFNGIGYDVVDDF